MSDQEKQGMSDEARYGRLCEYVFGEMGAAEREAFELELARDASLQAEHAELVATAAGVREVLPAEKLSDAMRATLSQAANGTGAGKPTRVTSTRRFGLLQAAAGILVLLGVGYGAKSLFDEEQPGTGEGLAGEGLGRKLDEVARLDESKRLNKRVTLGGDQSDRDSVGKLRELQSAIDSARISAGGSESAALKQQLQRIRERAAQQSQDPTLFLPTVTDGLVNSPRLPESVLAKRQEAEVPVPLNTSTPGVTDCPVLPDSIILARSNGIAVIDLNGFGQGPGETRLLPKESGTFRGPGDTVPPAGGRGGGAPGPSNPAASAAVGPSSPGSASKPAIPLTLESVAGPVVPPLVNGLSTFNGGSAGAFNSGPTVAGIRSIDELEQDSGRSPFGSIGERKEDSHTSVSFLLREVVPLASDEEEPLAVRYVPNGIQGSSLLPPVLADPPAPSRTRRQGSSEFYLGRGEAAPEAGFEFDGRRKAIAPTKEQVQELSKGVIFRCGLRMNETPNEMFFRAWGEHPFRLVADEPLSTFGADVDTASYTLARRTLRAGRLPVKEQVRSEEFLNYFRADQPAPEAGQVFGLHLESAPSLFGADPMMEMLRVTVRAQDVQGYARKPLALTLVIDVSGSMKDANRMPLVKRSLALLLTQLSYADSVGIVAFAARPEVLSEMTSAANRGALEQAVSGLTPDGGTNIGWGINLGFEVASRGLVEGATNRVILLSDGVGNIGTTDQASLLAQVDGFRKQGIYLNTIGVGMGDHNDHFLEQLADRGDGQCQYFDSAREAEKVLVNDLTKTLQPIARDVKIQVEFDPSQVLSYRQIGYENRAVATKDFRNDAVDAGEVNAGHQVTALYEIVRYPGARSDKPLATARVRYKLPFMAGASEELRLQNEQALEITKSIARADLLPSYRGASQGYRRALLVAQFAECLRRSIHARPDSLQLLLDEAQALATEMDDQEVYELKDLVKLAMPLLLDEREVVDMQLMALTDALGRLHYDQARREQMQSEGMPTDNAERHPSVEQQIVILEQRICEHMLKRAGLWEPEVNVLQHLGYYGDDEE